MPQKLKHSSQKKKLTWAVLEHMTIEERLYAMKDAWGILKPGGKLCIIGTPNRLHLLDSHTSQMPFRNWLPDDFTLMKYLSFSQRKNYKSNFVENNDSDNQGKLILEVYRWGRGGSFYEIELTLD